MRATIRLGRVAGVTIGLHWSVLGIGLLLMVGMSVSLPAAYPARSPLVYGAFGLVAAVLFLLSLLSHELAHAIVARRNGIRVVDITLWLLGGVARLRGAPPRPAGRTVSDRGRRAGSQLAARDVPRAVGLGHQRCDGARLRRPGLPGVGQPAAGGHEYAMAPITLGRVPQVFT